MEGLRWFQSNSVCFVTEIKSVAKNTLLTPLISKSLDARGDALADSKLGKSDVPLFKLTVPGINFRVSGFGVSSV